VPGQTGKSGYTDRTRKENEMRCVICHGDRIEITEVREEIELGNDIVYVPIKILVCKNCGERYYDRRAMQRLENIEKELGCEKP
jgi:YgiT-type zinc finger domain-containing protein